MLQSVVVSFFVPQSPTEVNFANQSFTLQANSIKLTIEVFAWPFGAIKNTLQIVATVDSTASKVCLFLFSFFLPVFV
jgi:hypothetical protein